MTDWLTSTCATFFSGMEYILRVLKTSKVGDDDDKGLILDMCIDLQLQVNQKARNHEQWIAWCARRGADSRMCWQDREMFVVPLIGARNTIFFVILHLVMDADEMLQLREWHLKEAPDDHILASAKQ